MTEPMTVKRGGLAAILGSLVLTALGGTAHAIVYCNITKVEAKELKNGVQITVSSDGSLEFEGDEGGWRQRVWLEFPGAKSALDTNFIDVGIFPVSYVQIAVPQNATEGVGIEMTVALFTPSEFEITRSTDQQQVIITVKSERTIEGNGPGKAEKAADVATKLDISYQDGRLTVYAVKADIHKLVARIARECGIQIAIDDKVKRETTISLEALPPIEVIRGIASAYGLALLERDGKFMISEGVPNDLATYNMSGTQSFRMQYVRAQTASGLLPTFLYSYLHVNPEQNAVVVTAPRQMLGKIEHDLKKIDVAPQQIMIEAIAVEYASTRDAEQSLSFARIGSDEGFGWNSRTGDLDYERWDSANNTADESGSQWVLVSRMPHDFDGQLKALVNRGRADVKARPRMVTLNGRSAEIFVGTERFILVRYLRYGNIQETIQGVNVGVTLNVTAWTGGNDEITTTISSEVSNIRELDPQTGLPLLSQRIASTTVRARDGETIVVGGLIQKQDYTTKRKVPILGDLPLIGGLFRSKDRTQTESELVILITPTILTPQGRLPDEAREADTRAKFLGEESGPPPAAGDR
ncbi:MAG: type II and III secretion system protein [Armatimonadetes bacterium]|nr:type II and III secretion system protein [Armatimonadota bacterium]